MAVLVFPLFFPWLFIVALYFSCGLPVSVDSKIAWHQPSIFRNFHLIPSISLFPSNMALRITCLGTWKMHLFGKVAESWPSNWQFWRHCYLALWSSIFQVLLTQLPSLIAGGICALHRWLGKWFFAILIYSSSLKGVNIRAEQATLIESTNWMHEKALGKSRVTVTLCEKNGGLPVLGECWDNLRSQLGQSFTWHWLRQAGKWK